MVRTHDCLPALPSTTNISHFVLRHLPVETQWEIDKWASETHPSVDLRYIQVCNALDVATGAVLYERLAVAPPVHPVLILVATAGNMGSAHEWVNLTRLMHPQSIIALAGR